MSVARTAAKAIFAAADRIMSSPAGPRILIYHQVGAGLGRQMEVTVEDFEWQLDWLAEHREVVDLDTAVARWAEPDSDRLVVLTFDDGYDDTYTTAFPRMVEHGFAFTLYLSTGALESGSHDAPTAPLGWQSIESMVETGLVTIGGHTHSHRDLREAVRDEVEEEIETSDEVIESRLGVRPKHFAYPWGYWSEQAAEVVNDRYRTAVLGGSPNPSAHPPVHELHRYPVQLSDGTRFFPSRIEGGLLLEEKMRRRLRGYSGP